MFPLDPSRHYKVSMYMLQGVGKVIYLGNEDIDLSIDLTNLNGQDTCKYICDLYNYI